MELHAAEAPVIPFGTRRFLRSFLVPLAPRLRARSHGASIVLLEATAVLFGVSLALGARCADACTSIIVGRTASVDGSTMVTYAADSHEIYGALRLAPGGIFAPGATRVIHDWDTGAYVGVIPQAERTYSVVGNMNEHQLVIAESTFGGREELIDPKGGLDYGSLIYVTLERARTAREAVETIGRLVDAHGYRSSGESFSIADPRETWIMEIIGKGPGRRGAVWVAQKLPENAVSAHANQARIRKFALRDPSNVLYSKDVISLAREKGWHQGNDADFSFADAYAPLDWQALRFCEARVWRVFDRVAPSLRLSLDDVLGKDRVRPLPLWVVPDRKVSVRDAQALMRDHFEGTPLDLSVGVGAGPFQLPYRWRPLTWKVDGIEYLNERAIATQQTGFSFVAQARSWLPPTIGGLLWFGVDDAASSVYMPIYASIREVPASLAEGTATLHRFSWDSAFWVFNWVANQSYGRYSDMIRDIQNVQGELEGSFFERQSGVEQAAASLHAQAPEQVRTYLTEYSRARAAETVERWRRLGEDLLVKYVDGNVKDPLGKVLHPPYSDDWYRRVVAEQGKLLRVGRLPNEPTKPDPKGRVTFSSATELGPLASVVPSTFPWDEEKLVLFPGTAQCGQLPRCCLSVREDPSTRVLYAEDGPLAGGTAAAESTFSKGPRAPLREPSPDSKGPSADSRGLKACGEPARLIRIPRAEERLPEVREEH